MNGAQSLFKALVDAGVTTCFANPGTSEMQLVYEIGMTDKMRPSCVCRRTSSPAPPTVTPA